MFLLLTSSSQWKRQWLIFDMKWRLGVLSYHIGLHWLVEMKSFEMRDALNAGALSRDRRIYMYRRTKLAYIRHFFV